MINFKIRFLAVTALLVLAACGGGGGGGDGSATDPAGGGPAGGATRGGQMVYFDNSTIYSIDMATGVSRAVAQTLNAKPAYVSHTLSAKGELLVAFYSDGFASNRDPYSRLVIYKPDGSVDTSFELDLKIVGAPSISPDGQTIALSTEVSSGILNVPPTYQTNFFDRNGVAQTIGISYVTPIDWLPDGRFVYKYIGDSGIGLSLATLPLKSDDKNFLLVNTRDATAFSVSPDGSKIAFVAKVSNLTPKHIYMIDVDGNNRRQVTTSRNDEESRVVFSPNGKELLIAAGSCAFSPFSGDSHFLQVIPADAIALDVTYSSTSPYVLKSDRRNALVCTTTQMGWESVTDQRP